MSSYHQLSKNAYANPYGGHSRNPGVANPYTNVAPNGNAWQSAPGVKSMTPPPTGSWLQRNVVDNPWLEGAAGLASFIPVVGGAINGAWQGGRAAYHTAQGNYGKAAEAAAWGAAGFIPGGAVARGVQLGASGAKALRAGNTLRSGLQAGRALAAPTGRFVNAASAVAPTIATAGATSFLPASPVPKLGPGYEPVNSLSSYGNNLMLQGVKEVRGR